MKKYEKVGLFCVIFLPIAHAYTISSHAQYVVQLITIISIPAPMHYFLNSTPNQAGGGYSLSRIEEKEKKASSFNSARGNTPQPGFTLVELLIVVAILGILSSAVVAILNPAELLKQARDSTRYADIDALNKALSVTAVDNLPLGTVNTVYVDIPDTSATCANLGLPILPTGWSYACATTTTLRNVNGTGWVPVNLTLASIGSPLGALPIDPTNATTTGLYYVFSSSGTNWSVKASRFESVKYIAKNQNGYSLGNVVPPHVFPENWVKVPGNSTFGTSDFYVMKYNAKCISGINPLTGPTNVYDVYDNIAQPCTGSYYAASTPDGYPIANVSHDTAKTYCANIGAHLLTNDEYMTIARNAEQVASNWTGGAVGAGAFFSGHNDNVPAYVLTADPFGDNGYYGETNTGGNQRRTLTLSNGSIVWDMAGNVWEIVQRSINNIGDTTTTMALPTCSDGTLGWEWCQYGSTPVNVSAWSSDVAQAKIGPSNTSWNATQGTGQIFTYGTGANQGTAVFIRGASWSAGSVAGVFALHLAWGTSDSSVSVGFRCAR